MKALLLPAAALLASCAALPGANRALDEARAVHGAAQSDPEAAARAPAELELSQRLLKEAQHAASAEDATHLAYLAEQHARIARELGAARANEAKAGEATQAMLEARLKKTEEERDRALAAAKAAETARDASDRLSAEVRRLQAQVAELQAERTQRGWILTLGSDVLFESGRSSLKPGGRRAIRNLASFMREHPERKIVIEGFTDDRGPPGANQRLSERRAEAVRQALVKEGIRGERIEARGRGSSYPVATNANARGRSLNRRVEILIGEGPGRAATGGGSSPKK